MIIDSILNSNTYRTLNSSISSALKFLQENPVHEWEPGRYEVGIPGMFILIQHYITHSVDDGYWEAHREYIDLQYMMEGSEKVGFANIFDLEITQDFLDENDYMVLTGEGDYFTLKQGNFAVFFPQDAHKPSIAFDAQKLVKKAVVKIRIN